MSTRKYSDRGSLKDIQKNNIDNDFNPPEADPYEARIKELYEFAEISKDKELKESLGFITIESLSNKNAMPLNVFRLRTIVEELKSRPGSQVEYWSNMLKNCFGDDIMLKKTASNHYKFNDKYFRRVIEL